MDKHYKIAKAVTLSDSTVYTPAPLAFYVGGAGNLAVVTDSGDSVTLTALLAGTIIPLRCKQFLLTGSTATAIVALY